MIASPKILTKGMVVNMGKFEDLVFKIPVENHQWYGFVSPRGFFRGTTMMEKARLYMDFTAVDKALPMEVPHTHHAADEYLVFTGADLTNFFEFDAEVDVWLGEDAERLEMFHITQPTIIRVPPKLYHCPVNFKRVTKPIVFSAVYLDGDWSKINRAVGPDGREQFTYDGAGIRRCVFDRSKECVYCGKCFSQKMNDLEDAKSGSSGDSAPESPQDDLLAPYYEMAKLPRTGKYDKYVYKFVPETHGDGRFLSPRAGFRGTDEMPESRLRYMYNIVQKPCELAGLHMHHAVEEYLWFTGADIAKFFDFDAEIEIALGESPECLESYKITEATIVRVPPKIWHSVRVTRLGAPIHFMPFYPSGEYGKIARENGVYRYDGTDLPGGAAL
ncbi:MAG: hypothetical protein LBD92_04690 [Oscillospiraceae bacterium]|jgi:hypothetical protein|nr:hypothetical protein [Oscillospiraceae bacterium]